MAATERVPSIYIVRDVASVRWFAYGITGVRTDSLWIVDASDGDGSALEWVVEAHRAEYWYALGTWGLLPGTEPRGFDERFPGLSRSKMSGGSWSQPNGQTFVSECCSIVPESSATGPFFESVRRSGGFGHAMAVGVGEHDAALFHAVSSGLLWRVAARGSGTAFEPIAEMSAAAYINLLPPQGILPIVPLDRHPLSGLVIFGTAEQIAHLARGCTLSGGEAEIEQQLISRGGGMVL